MSKSAKIYLFIDFQERLLKVIDPKQLILSKVQKLFASIELLEENYLITEHCPDKLGKSVIDGSSSKPYTYAKKSFSCYQNPEIKTLLDAHKEKKVCISGVEAHICVYLTAIELKNAGFKVEIIADCIGSREDINKSLIMQRFLQENMKITTMETCLFESLEDISHPNFKQIIQLIK